MSARAFRARGMPLAPAGAMQRMWRLLPKNVRGYETASHSSPPHDLGKFCPSLSTPALLSKERVQPAGGAHLRAAARLHRDERLRPSPPVAGCHSPLRPIAGRLDEPCS
eukprot:79426-Chlamydomonas_euryale.AAC.4